MALRQAVEAREDLLAVVSHDLRNPLHAIKLAAETLGTAETKGLLPENRVRCIEAVRRGTRRMSNLIEDILTAAKAENGRLPSIFAARMSSMVAKRCRNRLEPRRSIRWCWNTRMPRELPQASCDRGRILQVLANLTRQRGEVHAGRRPRLGGRLAAWSIHLLVRLGYRRGNRRAAVALMSSNATGRSPLHGR